MYSRKHDLPKLTFPFGESYPSFRNCDDAIFFSVTSTVVTFFLIEQTVEVA